MIVVSVLGLVTVYILVACVYSIYMYKIGYKFSIFINDNAYPYTAVAYRRDHECISEDAFRKAVTSTSILWIFSIPFDVVLGSIILLDMFVNKVVLESISKKEKRDNDRVHRDY